MFSRRGIFLAHPRSRLSIALQLWRDEDGIVFASEWMLLCTVILIATFAGVYIVRTASMKLFVNVAIGVAREQRYTFDKMDANYNPDPKAGMSEVNDNGLYGYRQQETSNFFDFIPNADDGGETPAEHNWIDATTEG